MPDIIPDKPEENGWKLHQVYDTRSPGIYEFSVDQPTWVRVTVVGKSADGTAGSDGGDDRDYESGGYGGNGGASGGIARRSILVMPDNPITVTINSSLVSFGEYLTATAATSWNAVGTVSGGEDFNLNGNRGGTGGSGGYEGRHPKPGNPGEASPGGTPTEGGIAGGLYRQGGGSGGGGQVPMPWEGYPGPPTIVRAGNGVYGSSERYQTARPGENASFSVTESEVIVSGGGGGGGGGPWQGSGGAAGAGCPGAIIIETAAS